MIKLFSTAAVAVVFAGASTAMAVGVSVGDYIRFSDGPGTTTTERPGGEFVVNVLQSGDSFRTFCLERRSHLHPPLRGDWDQRACDVRRPGL
jgi:hypothetical protein